MLEDQDLLSLQEVRTKVEKAYAAWQKYRTYSQEQVDRIVEAMAAAGRAQSRRLAEMAVEETGYGNVKDKIAKNLLAADLLARSLRPVKTIGYLREDKENKIVEYGESMGVVAAILPTTNPTSTAMYKILISLKAGNGIVLSPHPRAKRCTCETAAIFSKAATEAGAPEDLIQCVLNATMEGTNELMRHKRTAVILSTGGSGIVKAAYSSGKPAFGVGPGNVPVVVEKSADVADAVAKTVAGKSFDYGTLCSSEQALIVEAPLRDAVNAELKKNKAHLCDEKQKEALQKVLLLPPKWGVNPQCVGQSAAKIAQMAGFSVPEDTSILVVELAGVGREYPLSAEKLSPVLCTVFVPDFAKALETAAAVLRFGGLGHTCGIYSKDDAKIREYAAKMPAMRVLCNTPTPQGSVGITTALDPSFTLGCGAVAGNVTSDNITATHLVNIKRLAYVVRRPEEAFTVPADALQAPASFDGGMMNREMIAAAVDRYLAQRGLASNAPARQTSVVESVVDRFLADKRARGPAPAVSASCGIQPGSCCGGQGSCATAPASTPAQVSEPPKAAEPVVQIVDFVCEDDVRQAVQQSRKIYIGPKTIVTPSARDMAAQHETLVVAKR
jgi:acyl-CoA reductase-like NAD-dependent aldehyde dehydrogenase